MLAPAGYVAPARVSAGIDPNTIAYQREWWEQTFMLCEYDDARGDYPQKPVDYTQLMTAGRSLNGNRRT
jgi:hypothetical protein